jgi:hypothetical protein
MATSHKLDPDDDDDYDRLEQESISDFDNSAIKLGASTKQEL